MEHQTTARRSCDQCRARKIRCDRLMPCSNCSSAKVECAHSRRTVSKGVTTNKQRILISQKYEQKIDGIARDLEIIKSLLRSTPEKAPSREITFQIGTSYDYGHDDKHDPRAVATHPWMDADERWRRSNTTPNITDLVRSVINDVESGTVMVDDTDTTSSLTSFLRVLEQRPNRRVRALTTKRLASEQSKVSMPPLDEALTVLRWARAREGNDDATPMDWVAHILPREIFQESCQRVYFAIEAYDEADFVLANAYLGRIYAEYWHATHLDENRAHSDSCRLNLRIAMSNLRLHTQPSLEMTAALAVSAFTAVESSQASMAWDFISAALNMCQTLGYHCKHQYVHVEPAMQDVQMRLFWIIYRLERSLALRFNRSSNILDSEITAQEPAASMRHIRLGKIHGKIYDLLYSREAMEETNASSRGDAARILAGELQQIIQGMKDQLQHLGHQDPMKRMDLMCDIICQSSTLTLILRAAAPTTGTAYGISDRCIATAREVLDLHHQCMMIARNGENNLEMYMNWNLVHVPFVPFIILFHRAVQLCDSSDLATLERFAASLGPEIVSNGSTSHTFHLYEVLYQTARLHIERYSHHTDTNPRSSKAVAGFASHLEFAQFGADVAYATQGSSPLGMFDLDSWCDENQHLLSLLDDDTWV